MKTLIKFFLLSSLIFFSQFNKTFSEEKINIGVILPLSGEYQEIGKAVIKAVQMAINKIDDDRIAIHVKDNRSDPDTTLDVARELYSSGIKIIIGPIFQKNLIKLSNLEDVTFISFTNRIKGNPKNVISAGVNAISQTNTIKKFQIEKDIKRSLFLIPKGNFEDEINYAIKKTSIKLKDKIVYETDPTKLTSQIEKITRYPQRKQNLIDEIKRLEDLDIEGNKNRIESLKKKDTLGGINFDSVIIADFDESLKSVVTSLLYTDVSSNRIKYITFNQWFDKSLLKEKSLQPIYYPSVNRANFVEFNKKFKKIYNQNSNQIAFLSYDIVGLVYYLLFQNNFSVDKNLFYKRNRFKGKIGIFEINKNIITHQLNFYVVDDGKIKEIF